METEKNYNYYVAKVKPEKHSLIVQLSAEAKMNFQNDAFENLSKGKYKVVITDINDASWEGF